MNINFDKIGNAKIVIDKGEQGTVELIFNDGALTDVTVTQQEKKECAKPYVSNMRERWRRQHPSMRELIDKSAPIVDDIKKAQAQIILKKEEEKNAEQQENDKKNLAADLFFGNLKDAGNISKAKKIIELDKNGTLDAYIKEIGNNGVVGTYIDKVCKDTDPTCGASSAESSNEFSTAYKNWKHEEPRIDKNGNDKR